MVNIIKLLLRLKMDTRKIIDYAAEDNAKDFRESLYASIYDKVNAHIEQKKQEIAHGLVTQESCATKGDAKKIAKKEVKKHKKVEGSKVADDKPKAPAKKK